ncbi:MAG: tetratricopeptide repeat protein [Pseudonocardiaceae bacterium]
MVLQGERVAPSVNRTADVAQALGCLKRFGDAESLLAEAMEDEPESAELQYHLSLIREHQGNLEGALAACRRAVEFDPVDVAVRTAQIDLLCRFRRFDEAEAAALSALDLLPRNGRIRVARARPLRERDQESEAEEVLRTALKECEDVLPIRLGLLSNLSGQGRFDEALQVADQMLTQDPHNIAAHWWKVDLLADAHRHDMAIRHSERVTRLRPTSVRLRLQLGWLLHETGDFDGALVEFESVCAMLPTVLAVRRRANTLCRLRRFGEAETVLLEEIRKKPNYAILRHELAWTYWKQAKHKQALVECERARKIEFGPVLGIVCQAVMLRRLNRWEDSEKILEEAIPRFPDSPLLQTQVGLLRDDQNRYLEALEWFDQALEIDPLHIVTLVAKSASLRSLGRFGEAEVTLAPALARFPASSELLVERGWIFRDQGQLSRAEQIFAEVADNAPSPGVRLDARRCLGWTVFSDGKYEVARDIFRKVLAEDANFTDAKIGLAWSLVRLDDLESDQTAEQLCLDILATDPRNHLAHTCVGVLYARQRDFQLAEHHLRHSLELDPFDGSFVDLAVLFTDLERFDEAEQLLSKALDRNWYDIQAHIEFGRLHLLRDIDSGKIGEEARRAGVHFRQALTLDPTSSAAATGLAVTLSRLPGDLTEAERVVRRVIGRAEQSQDRWPLLLTLARLLIERSDANQRPELHLEALVLAQEAIDLANQEAEPYFVAGIAAFKAGSQNTDVRLVSRYRRQSVRYLRHCLERDNQHEEARRVIRLAEQSVAVTGGSLAGSRALTWATALLLVGVQAGFFLTNKISEVVFATMTTVLVGLFALSFVLPHLVRLKLPGGVEADLSASLAQVSEGPTGELSIGRGRFTGTNNDFGGPSLLNAGPRGELPRLGSAIDEQLV